MLQTIQKAGRVLDLFSLERPEWGVSDVAEALGLPKSSVSVLMSTLADQNLLHRTGERRYRLGWRILALGEIVLRSAAFLDRARGAMEHLVSRSGELVHLAALEDGHVVYVDKAAGYRAIRVPVTGRGLRLPAHGSGVGKVLWANRPWEEVLRTVGKLGLSALTPNTITSSDALKDELDRVRDRGYAYDREETVPNLSCVAAPIRDHTGEVVAAMSFSVPAYRFEQGEERYRVAIVEVARAVSQDLGFSP